MSNRRSRLKENASVRRHQRVLRWIFGPRKAIVPNIRLLAERADLPGS